MDSWPLCLNSFIQRCQHPFHFSRVTKIHQADDKSRLRKTQELHRFQGVKVDSKVNLILFSLHRITVTAYNVTTPTRYYFFAPLSCFKIIPLVKYTEEYNLILPTQDYCLYTTPTRYFFAPLSCFKIIPLARFTDSIVTGLQQNLTSFTVIEQPSISLNRVVILIVLACNYKLVSPF